MEALVFSCADMLASQRFFASRENMAADACPVDTLLVGNSVVNAVKSPFCRSRAPRWGWDRLARREV